MTEPLTYIIPQREIREEISTIMNQVGQTMFGMEEVSRLCLVALYCGGHVLLEGNPGLGKTKLARTFEKVLGFPYKRIQFTPDLMPTDITGSKMPSDEDRRKLIFQKGPIFTNLLLADEINRASPKTQAAMLEAMAEKEVTVQGATYRLDRPFMVIATQNPVDHEGTYPLPEAQADRFMFKIFMPFPSAEIIRQIMAASTGPIKSLAGENPSARPIPEVRKRAKETFQNIMFNIRRMKLSPPLESHIVNLLLATNGHMDQLTGLKRNQMMALNRLSEQLFQFGLGPRASENLSLGCKAYALLFLDGSDGVAGPEALAHVVLPILRHRIKLSFDWEERFAGIQGFELNEDESREGLLDAMLAMLCDATAPNDHEFYRSALVRLLKSAVAINWVKRARLF